MFGSSKGNTGKIIIVKCDDDDIYFSAYCGILLLLYIFIPSYFDHAIRSICPLLRDVFDL